jgi:hypothetical protein
MTPRQKAQQIVDEIVGRSWYKGESSERYLLDLIQKALQEAAKVELGKRCPCGGIILADTDECKVPVCIECCIEISKSYLNMDQNYNEGFKRGMEAAKVEWPSEDDIQNAWNDRWKMPTYMNKVGSDHFKAGFRACEKMIQDRWPDDSDIERASLQYEGDFSHYHLAYAFRQGANWLKSRMTSNNGSKLSKEG